MDATLVLVAAIVGGFIALLVHDKYIANKAEKVAKPDDEPTGNSFLDDKE